jgi:outer membrane protein assembly factor BamE (lipoprotein component of BamABCDE complex)
VRRTISLGLFIAVATASCTYGLHPRTTLEGRPFPMQQIEKLREGQSSAEVRALLGEPFEIAQTADGVRWRYFERWLPRGCNVPTFALDAHVTFRRDVVADISVRGVEQR